MFQKRLFKGISTELVKTMFFAVGLPEILQYCPCLFLIEAYGALKEIKKETDQAKTARAEMEGKIQMLKETYTEYSARNTAILDQFEALNAKAIEVGRTVGSVEEQLKGDTMTRDLLTLLRNPTSASYEDSLPLVLVLLKCVTVWAMMHKSKFRYPSLVDKSLQDLAGYLGGS
jgi:hypothetical protein